MHGENGDSSLGGMLESMLSLQRLELLIFYIKDLLNVTSPCNEGKDDGITSGLDGLLPGTV